MLTPTPSASFTLTPAPSAGFTLDRSGTGQQQTNTGCATAADVQKISSEVQALLNTRLGTLETKINGLPTNAQIEAKIREIVKAEVANEVKAQLKETQEKVQSIQSDVAELKKNALTKKDVIEAVKEAMKKE